MPSESEHEQGVGALDDTVGAISGDAASGDDRPREATELIGGRYEVIGWIGAGGMGNVYRVRDRELDEVVPLSALRPRGRKKPGVHGLARRGTAVALEGRCFSPIPSRWARFSFRCVLTTMRSFRALLTRKRTHRLVSTKTIRPSRARDDT